MPLTVKVEGADKLERGLAKAGQSLMGDLHAALEQSALLVEADARRAVPQDTRRLMGSITHRFRGKDAVEVGPSTQYGLFVEVGRRPGKQPPIRAIEPWARRHGAVPFLVARAIGLRGVKARPYLIPAYEKNRRRIEGIFEQMGAKLVGRIVSG